MRAALGVHGDSGQLVDDCLAQIGRLDGHPPDVDGPRPGVASGVEDPLDARAGPLPGADRRDREAVEVL
jgi:hypothetical protein